MQKAKIPTPTESVEQQLLFRWAAWCENMYPGIELMHHIPNGGHRSKSEAGRFKAEGVKPGIPDIFLPVARGKYHGLYIELKRTDGRATKGQLDMLAKLEAQGYRTAICYGFDAAKSTIIEYYTEIAGCE